MRFWLLVVFCVGGLVLVASALFADDRSIDFSAETNPDSMTSSAVLAPRVGFQYLEQPGLYRSPGKSVLLSLAFPGLGQAWNARWAKASGFVVVGSMLIARIAVESQRSRRYLDLYRNAHGSDDAEEFYGLYSLHLDRRDRLIWWAVCFWLYNLFDAYVDAHLFGFSRQ